MEDMVIPPIVLPQDTYTIEEEAYDDDYIREWL